MSNKQIAKLLRDVAAAYSIKSEGKYRFQILAYRKAADSIEDMSQEVVDLAREGGLSGIPGVGASIKGHLEELVTTGKVKHFEWVLKDTSQAVYTLLELPTFGAKKAYKLVEALNLDSAETAIEDLEKAALAGKIAKIPSFGEKSQQDILRAIDDYRKGKGKITRMVLPVAAQVADRMIKFIKEDHQTDKAVTLGSLRRRKETVGDVDIAVTSHNPQKTIDHFIDYPYKERVIEKGTITASLLVSGGKQVDLMVLPPDSFGSLLQHFTGSKDHNVHLREIAIKKGFSLSEKGIKIKSGKKETMKKFASEEEFYEFLGMDWVPPEIRENTGEIELSQQHSLPKLVELKDIKGDLHIHSAFPIEPSHDMGGTTIEEHVVEALKLGYEYIGFSEHNPSVSKHKPSQIVDLIKKRNEEIDLVNDRHKKITAIKLMETDILANGQLAVPEEGLNQLDGTIVSIHSGFSTNATDITKRILSGLAHPKAKILAHPTGRLLNARAGYNPDFEKIFDFALKNNKAIEINAWPQRLDLPDELVRQAVELGVKMVIDTDSHALQHMKLMEYGVSVARRGWATKKDILNTLSVDDFLTWLKT